MEPLKLQSDWNVVKDRLMEININITHEDLEYRIGQEEDLLIRLQKKINKTPEEIRGIIESISGNSGKAG